MTNKAKYDAIFMEVFEISLSDLTDDLEYQSISSWDSVGHMSLIAELEDEFDVMLEMDDIVDFGSYRSGITTLEKYGVKF